MIGIKGRGEQGSGKGAAGNGQGAWVVYCSTVMPAHGAGIHDLGIG